MDWQLTGSDGKRQIQAISDAVVQRSYQRAKILQVINLVAFQSEASPARGGLYLQYDTEVQ